MMEMPKVRLDVMIIICLLCCLCTAFGTAFLFQTYQIEALSKEVIHYKESTTLTIKPQPKGGQ